MFLEALDLETKVRGERSLMATWIEATTAHRAIQAGRWETFVKHDDHLWAWFADKPLPYNYPEIEEVAQMLADRGEQVHRDRWLLHVKRAME